MHLAGQHDVAEIDVVERQEVPAPEQHQRHCPDRDHISHQPASPLAALVRPEKRDSKALCAAPAAMTRTAARRSEWSRRRKTQPPSALRRLRDRKQAVPSARRRLAGKARRLAALRRRSSAAKACQCRSRTHGAPPASACRRTRRSPAQRRQQRPQEQQAGDREGERTGSPPPARPPPLGCTSDKGAAPRNRSAASCHARIAASIRAARIANTAIQWNAINMVRKCRMRVLPSESQDWAFGAGAAT